MSRLLRVRKESWPIRGSFRISRGAKTVADVVVAEISDGPHIGRGEGVPYPRYGETVDDIVALLESMASDVAAGLTRADLQDRLPAGAARNALDCALIDLEARITKRPAYDILGLPPPRELRTAYTLSLDSAEAMAAVAHEAAAKNYRLLKLKLGGPDDLARVEAIRRAAPDAVLIGDANEGWSFDELVQIAAPLAALGVALIEQPVKADEDAALAGWKSPLPLCADESCHTRADLARIVGRYSHINIKLDKTGGLTEAVALANAAKGLGLKAMVGCMVSTSLSMAPAALLGSTADFVDLDGPLLLARDREPGLIYRGDVLCPAPPGLWGTPER